MDINIYTSVYIEAILKPSHCMSACHVPNSWSYNYISKVLFISPSRYLFPIGFGHVSLIWWSVPPVYVQSQISTTRMIYIYTSMSIFIRSHELHRVHTRDFDPNSPSVANRLCSRQSSTFYMHTTITLATNILPTWWYPPSFAMTAGIRLRLLSSEYWYA